MRHTLALTLAAGVLCGVPLLASCETAPKTAAERESLLAKANATLQEFKAADPSLEQFFNSSHGYAVFPSVGTGAFIVGGGYGRGIVYEGGRPIGYADITSGSIGLQAGGQGYSEIIFFQTEDVMNKFKDGTLSFAADANAVLVESGAAAATNFRNGVAVFIRDQSGAMVAAAIGGQQFDYEPMESSR